MSDEVKAFKMAMRAHHPNATPGEESIAWRLWQSAWCESKRGSEPVEPPKATRIPPQGYLDDIEGDGMMDYTAQWRAFASAWGIDRRRCSDMREDLDRLLRPAKDGTR